MSVYFLSTERKSTLTCFGCPTPLHAKSVEERTAYLKRSDYFNMLVADLVSLSGRPENSYEHMFVLKLTRIAQTSPCQHVQSNSVENLPFGNVEVVMNSLGYDVVIMSKSKRIFGRFHTPMKWELMWAPKSVRSEMLPPSSEV